MGKLSRFEAMQAPKERPGNPAEQAHIFGQPELSSIRNNPSDARKVLDGIRERLRHLNDAPKYFPFFSDESISPFTKTILEDDQLKRRMLFEEFDGFGYLLKTFPDYLVEEYLQGADDRGEDVTRFEKEDGTFDDDAVLKTIREQRVPFTEYEMKFALESAIADDIFPKQLFVEAVEAYVHKAMARHEEVERDRAEDMRFALEALKIFFTDQPLLAREMERRVDSMAQRVNVIYADGFNEDMIWGSGTHDVESRDVKVDMWAPRERRRHALVHELVHELEGITAIESETGAKIIRGGLAFSVEESRARAERKRRPRRFRWLNEAVTESVTLGAMRDKAPESGGYPTERAILENMIQMSNGVLTHKDFYTAYFEDYRLDGQALVHWDQLQDKLSAVFGPRFLQSFDGYLAKVGESKGLREFEEALKAGNWKELLEKQPATGQ